MSRSTFSGPVLVGIDDAPFSENEVAKTGPNWGFVNMVQSYPIEEKGGQYVVAVIPNKSVITRISALVTTAWSTSSGAALLRVGTAWGTFYGYDYNYSAIDLDEDDLVKDMAMQTLGMTVAGPGDTDNLTTGDINNWMNLPREAPFADRMVIYDTSPDAGVGVTGVGVLTVEYCQAVDLSAIA